jgi:hypothetical protein
MGKNLRGFVFGDNPEISVFGKIGGLWHRLAPLEEGLTS